MSTNTACWQQRILECVSGIRGTRRCRDQFLIYFYLAPPQEWLLVRRLAGWSRRLELHHGSLLGIVKQLEEDTK